MYKKVLCHFFRLKTSSHGCSGVFHAHTAWETPSRNACQGCSSSESGAGKTGEELSPATTCHLEGSHWPGHQGACPSRPLCRWLKGLELICQATWLYSQISPGERVHSTILVTPPALVGLVYSEGASEMTQESGSQPHQRPQTLDICLGREISPVVGAQPAGEAAGTGEG